MNSAVSCTLGVINIGAPKMLNKYGVSNCYFSNIEIVKLLFPFKLLFLISFA